MPRRDDARARPHLALDRTEGDRRTWQESGGAAAAEIEKDLDTRLERLHQIADRIYDRWTENLSRG